MAGPKLPNRSFHSCLGCSFGAVAIEFIQSATWVRQREATVTYRLTTSTTVNKTRPEEIHSNWNKLRL